MRRIHWGVFIGLFFSSVVLAANNQTIQPSLNLNQIKMIKGGEALGDDLYFDISILKANQPTQYLRVPKYPLYWPSTELASLKSVPLWSESLKNGQKIILIISLIDQDAKPMNPDDVIGVIRVELHNEHGHLQARWSMPNQKEGPIVSSTGSVQKFELSNNAYGHYEVLLSLDK
ncbi:hypothetical protein [Legionella oakridgensis]|uniref:Uncharacterized protein n=2 Tax=Legionella oakridgensis TaxID=29423 RepID=W0B8S5_9GAMM|nr:hypothetical protein [Legionella oakridgensis]AHE66938.1 hypothetical protein Loa_01385 [Legionella oakridgensis ATCC 33761 = DSM 21215]ETO93393.1 hypothetical protein LOR_60c14140 [Legionella oakridgensis RV-2-2007]KTD39506.1 hypothetical protein Loak_0932 [Legionella oakridgensis]STY20044.1 Uncharacterised protein [Legionella longbeachae]